MTRMRKLAQRGLGDLRSQVHFCAETGHIWLHEHRMLLVHADAQASLRKELVAWVRKEIGPIATPDLLQWAPSLPKTRSGKIMRRILRKIAENQPEALGDTTTLADPSVVQSLVEERLVK